MVAFNLTNATSRLPNSTNAVSDRSYAAYVRSRRAPRSSLLSLSDTSSWDELESVILALFLSPSER